MTPPSFWSWATEHPYLLAALGAFAVAVVDSAIANLARVWRGR